MSCNEIRASIEDYVADTLDDVTRGKVLDHVAQCDRCRSELADMDALDRRLKSAMGTIAVSSNFESRVMGLIQGEETYRVRRFAWAWKAPLLAAACLALVLGVVWMLARPKHDAKAVAQVTMDPLELCEPGPASTAGIGRAFVIGKEGNRPYFGPAGIRIKETVRGAPVLLVDAFPGKDGGGTKATL